jgi:hypothetical protein
MIVPALTLKEMSQKYMYFMSVILYDFKQNSIFLDKYYWNSQILNSTIVLWVVLEIVHA